VPAVIARLKGEWEDDYQRWQKRDLSACRYVSVWADGVYLQARMEPQTEGMPVLIGAPAEGKPFVRLRRVDRLPDGHAGERAELDGIARRFEGARLADRAGSRRRPLRRAQEARLASGKLSTRCSRQPAINGAGCTGR